MISRTFCEQKTLCVVGGFLGSNPWLVWEQSRISPTTPTGSKAGCEGERRIVQAPGRGRSLARSRGQGTNHSVYSSSPSPRILVMARAVIPAPSRARPRTVSRSPDTPVNVRVSAAPETSVTTVVVVRQELPAYP